MEGRADGNRGMVKGHVKKRGLDDESRAGLGLAGHEAKRRHTAGAAGDDGGGGDEYTPTRSTFRYSAHDIRTHDAPASSESQLGALSFSETPSGLQAHHFPLPPERTGSAAGASGVSEGLRGPRLVAAGGIFSGLKRHTPKPSPAGKPQRFATGPQRGRKQSKAQDDILPASGAGEELVDDDEDDALFSLPKTRQRPKAPGRGGNLGGQDTEESASYATTSSGKDYHDLIDQDAHLRTSDSVFSPGGWNPRTVSSRTGLHYYCPIRTCRQKFGKLDKFKKHFRKAHNNVKFNGNLDHEGALETEGPTAPAASSVVISQDPRYPPSLTYHQPHASYIPRSKAPTGSDIDGYEPSHTVSEAVENSPLSQDADFSSAHADDENEEKTSKGSSDLDLAMAESEVWAYVSPLVPRTWTASLSETVEITAFIQAISLPLRNKIDKEWLQGTKKSNQKMYRALMSVIFHVIGVKALCKPCESKIPERRRNCMVLPPESKGMRELQQIYGSQCVNCYFFPSANKPCALPTSSTMAATKQTPVPVPIPHRRPPQNSRPSPPVPGPASGPDPIPVPPPSRPSVPSYSQYKAMVASKPISESPVPVPLFAAQGINNQLRSSHASSVSSEESHTGPIRRPSCVTMADSSLQSRPTTDKTDAYPATSVVSNTRSSRSTLAASGSGPGGSSSELPAAATSDVPSSNVSSSQLIGRVFSLFGDISKLADEEEKAALLGQMQQMATMLQTSMVMKTSVANVRAPPLPRGASPAAEWEIAPGRLMMDDKSLALSTSFLSREPVSLKAAHHLSRRQRVLNKSIAALHQLRVGPEDGWTCTCSVMRGVLKIKTGDAWARIGPGGVFAVGSECILTNVSHKEAMMQVWWMMED